MKLYIKWSNLTAQQRIQVAFFFQDEVKEKKMILNQHSYRISATTGNFIPQKDF